MSFFLLFASCTTIPDSRGPSEPSQQAPEAAGEETSDEPGKAEVDDREIGAAKEDARRTERKTGLPKEEIFRLSRQTVPERFLFIEEGGAPVSLFHDLDGNGYRDVMYLLVEKNSSLAEGISEAKEETLETWYSEGSVPARALSSVSRIYAEAVEPVDYYLSVFLQAEEELVSMYRIPLGAWKVFEDFYSLEIVERASMPYCVSSSFQTTEGKERIWVIFSRYNKFSTFTLTDTVSRHTELRDIDGDGTLDVIQWSQIFEEGTGYETFLSWYRWNGEKYEQYKSANVVRSLNDFLSKSGRLLQAGMWEEAFSHMMRSADYERFRSMDYGFSEIFSLLFSKPEEPEDEEDSRQPAARESSAPEDAARADATDRAEGAEEEDAADRDEAADGEELLARNGGARTFKMVVFPRIMENPFSRYVEASRGPPYSVKLAVRFSTDRDTRFVRYCKVQMDENPFTPPQFFLAPENP